MLNFIKYAAVGLTAPIIFTSNVIAQDAAPQTPQAVSPSQPQDITPEQAKFIGDQFVKCAALYSASADSYSVMETENLEEKAKIVETGKMLSMQAEIAAAMMYSIYKVEGTDTIESRVTAEKSKYTALISADSPQIKAEIQTCAELIPIQKQLVELAMKVLESNQQANPQ